MIFVFFVSFFVRVFFFSFSRESLLTFFPFVSNYSRPRSFTTRKVRKPW